MVGVKAHMDGRWQAPKVATILVWCADYRRSPSVPPVVRRYIGSLGSAEALVMRIKQMSIDAGWPHLPTAGILIDGVPWMRPVEEVHFPGVRQPLEDHDLSEHLYAIAHRLYLDAPEHATH